VPVCAVSLSCTAAARHQNSLVATNPNARGIPFGRFQLLERLGRGGMAEVWKAKTVGPMGYARKLVVKRILPELHSDADFTRMFVSEARLSSLLDHRNIVQVYEFGEVDGEYYLAMEYVHGRDLNSLLRTLRERNETPDVGMALYVAREVCRALAYAHSLTDENGTPLQLIHRDVSPSNVMIGFDGSVKLLDFGIAKAMAVASENCTKAGVLKGKFGYMAPEQTEVHDEVDHRADLFAAGILLWEMLTVHRLFKGLNDVQTITRVRAAQVAPPSRINPAVPPALDQICLHALARRRDQRIADCATLAALLDEMVHELKYGSDQAARLMKRLFPDVPEPTQQIAMVPPPAHEPTPQTPTPAGERFAVCATALTSRQPLPSATRLRRAMNALGGPSLRRERRVLIAAAATVALAGVVLGARPPARSGAAAHPPTAPAASAPWPPAPVSVTPPLGPTIGLVPVAPTVTIQLSTKPAGALVKVEGEARPRGVTPMTLELPREAAVKHLTLTARGYQRLLAEVTPDVDSRLHFDLERAPREAARRRVALRKNY
jgi:serine/threonine protein kinase